MTTFSSDKKLMDRCALCHSKDHITCETGSVESNKSLRKVTMTDYKVQPMRYELREGSREGAPNCPYGNSYKWIGFDLELKEYVRFTKSVFTLFIQKP